MHMMLHINLELNLSVFTITDVHEYEVSAKKDGCYETRDRPWRLGLGDWVWDRYVFYEASCFAVKNATKET
jgi:hypothetical protein